MKLLTLVPIFAIAATGFASGPLQREFEVMTKKIDACLLKLDMAGFEKIVRANSTKDFKHVENGQALTLDQTIAQMKVGLGMMKKMTKVESKFLTFKQTGNTVVAKQSHVMEASVTGEDKKPHKMAYVGVSVNTYRKEGGKWKMAIMNWTRTKMTMDGKPFDPSKMGGS